MQRAGTGATSRGARATPGAAACTPRAEAAASIAPRARPTDPSRGRPPSPATRPAGRPRDTRPGPRGARGPRGSARAVRPRSRRRARSASSDVRARRLRRRPGSRPARRQEARRRRRESSVSCRGTIAGDVDGSGPTTPTRRPGRAAAVVRAARSSQASRFAPPHPLAASTRRPGHQSIARPPHAHNVETRGGPFGPPPYHRSPTSSYLTVAGMPLILPAFSSRTARRPRS